MMNFDFTPPSCHETLWVGPDRLRIAGPFPGTDLWIVEVECPPGAGTPPHSHASAELFWMLEGKMTFRNHNSAAIEALHAEAGATLAIPGGAAHSYANESDAPARFVTLLDGSMIAFFREVGRPTPPAAGDAPDFAFLAAAMSRHGIQTVATAA